MNKSNKELTIEEKIALRLKKKQGKDKNEEVAMAAPIECRDQPCDDNCEKKVAAKEELKKDILSKDFNNNKKQPKSKKNKQYKILGVMLYLKHIS
jgi:hypothetical protein